ncbi:glucose-1-phosphate cytidylyltransferase [Agriterribacter sp.]|uniref:glucose-1-phosphate cytidylyltransferase n=1 Tax=Agriterribacter sp. TaxID=2821509 RepID=UPI002C47BC9A|nr:glucose-1-phosphate cytidylyltransferase [Agriterribacter sp.]HRO45084.1 glucose-1-phosphate cytidylyltransferase [Agriterribacter sp.]HRQ15475.1 glucose-1-phosphate cytidylyltransferase [Agriterribacter sp.]
MKVIIFAGGLGTRLAEETDTRPKPMVEIGGKPILWHIMKIYSHYGFNDFIICLGYKGYVIKEYFMNYFLHNSDISIDLGNNSMQVLGSKSEAFKVTLLDTGLHTKTAGRLKQVQKYVGDEDFMLTYGDGVGNINLNELLQFHHSHNKIATVTAVQLDARFGGMDIGTNGEVVSFREKAKDESKWINAGFFVLKPAVFQYLDADMNDMMWEDEPLEQLAANNELVAFKHTGFWKCMDAMRDKLELEALWKSNQAKWKKW